jgi:hypothetical protein
MGQHARQSALTDEQSAPTAVGGYEYKKEAPNCFGVS